MPSKKQKAKKSSVTKTPPQPPPPRLRLRLRLPYRIPNNWLWSWTELPPINPSYHITAARKLWLNTFNLAYAVTKSRLPTTTTTRCDAHHNQPPQLRHIATAPTHNPSPLPPCYHYLHDSTTIAEAASKMPDASHWRVLRRTTTARIIIPTPKPQSNPLGPVQLLHSCALGPTWPSSGVNVRYTVSRALSSWMCTSNTGVSVRYECNAPDPFDTKKKKSMEFTSMVRFQGRYYAMSAQGALAMMEVVDTRLTITAVTTATRGVPRSNWRFFKEYLFEMNGEIMLAFLIHRESLAVVDHVEVLKLGSSRFDWVKVEMLRGKTVFLNRRCLWVDSEEFGCGDNRVYFTEGSEERWKVFNMKTCCINFTRFFWVELAIKMLIDVLIRFSF